MNEVITKNQRKCIEEFLVEISIEPEQFGVKDVKIQRTEVVGMLKDWVNKSYDCQLSDEQVAEVYDRVMAGGLDELTLNYFREKVSDYRQACIELYYDSSSFFNYFRVYLKGVETPISFSKQIFQYREDCMADIDECLGCAMMSFEHIEHYIFRKVDGLAAKLKKRNFADEKRI